jgi:nucleoside-diphosphate-sugar epimerase
MRGQSILVTGAAGLIGHTLCRKLRSAGVHVTEIDFKHSQLNARIDIRDSARMQAALRGVSGIIHLAAVSRVVHGEMDPETCWDVNVNGTRKIVDLCLGAPHPLWLLYASSRAVYGQQDKLPANEDSPLKPMNSYARSKLAAENLLAEARANGLATAVLRFSNVYGDARDHADRVIPAFARAAVQGGEIRIEGRDHSFDFTHVNDVTNGVCSVVLQLAVGERNLPTIHLVSGIPTTLGALASLAVERAAGHVTLIDGKPRNFDVSYFYGDPSRASELLGWTAKIDLPTGFSRLADDIEARLAEGAAEPGLNCPRARLA